jgi:hypothetical protein
MSKRPRRNHAAAFKTKVALLCPAGAGPAGPNPGRH